MAKSVSRLVFLIAAVMLLVSGCGRQTARGKLAVGPDPDTLALAPEFAAMAIDACGGMKAWIGARQFDLDCVATFYQADGSHYLTEQQYTVYPWSNSIRIAGTEPDGDFIWEARGREFSAVQGGKEIGRITELMPAEAIAEAVLAATVVPARLLDGRAELTQMAAPVKLEGRWYSVVTRAVKPELRDTVTIADVTFYQNRETSVVDRVLIALGEKLFMVNSYGYRELQKGGVRVPSRLEVFEANGRGASVRRLIKIDVK